MPTRGAQALLTVAAQTLRSAGARALAVWRWARPGLIPGIGCALVALSLVLPWFDIPLERERSAWRLSVHLSGLPHPALLNYGVVQAICLLTVIASVVWRRQGRNSLAFTAGMVAASSAVAFVALTALADMPLLQHLQTQNTEFRSITQLFGYKVPRTQPSSVLFIPLAGIWRTVATSLRAGWYCAVIGGLLIAGANLRVAWGTWRRARVRAHLAIPAAVVLALLAVFARPIAANIVAGAAISTSQAGDYVSALRLFSFMESLDRDMRQRTGVEQAWGNALRSVGDVNSPMALFADSRAQAALGNTTQQVDDLTRAVKAAPDDPTIVAEYVGAARRAAQQNASPGPLLVVVRTPFGDMPAEHYALGRVLYQIGDFSDALPQFDSVLGETTELNTRSSAYTYRALCEIRLGQQLEARTDLLRAVAADKEYNNSLARSLAAGLYTALPA